MEINELVRWLYEVTNEPLRLRQDTALPTPLLRLTSTPTTPLQRLFMMICVGKPTQDSRPITVKTHDCSVFLIYV